MPRKKSKGPAKAPKSKSTPRHHHPSAKRPSRPWAPEEAAQSKFSLADEAMWSANHRSRAFDADKKLRFLRVDFVSAGLLEGTIKEMMPPPPPRPESPTNAAAMAQMSIRSPSPSPSACSGSSQEEVVFRGRSTTPFTQSTAPTKPTPTLPNKELPTSPALSITISGIQQTDVSDRAKGTSQDMTSLSDTIPQLTASTSDEPTSLPVRMTPSASASDDSKAQSQGQEPTLAHTDSDSESVVDEVFKRRLGNQPAWMSKTTPWESRSKPGIGWLPVQDRPDMLDFINGDVDPAAAAREDYMQNIQDIQDSAVAATFARRDMDLGSADEWLSELREAEKRVDNDDGWNSDTLRDFDGLSTSSDVIDTIDRILARRSRKELQYLVVYEGCTADDAHWLPASYFRSAKDSKLVQMFDAEHPPRSSSSNSDSEAIGAFDDDDEGEDDTEDEDDVEMDDERLARVLQRQEELGLGSAEVVLFGGDEVFNGPAGAPAAERFDRPWKKRQDRSKAKASRRQPAFPSASAMADVLDMDPYGGFDVMDTERPSLRPRKKGRRGQMPPELSDSELNEQLQTSWAADRAKKRLKKAEREELRKQGLLGRKGKAPDLSVKYKDGVDMNEVIEEIRDFMFSDMQTLSLPPMEAHRRAVVHQVVNQLGVSSKSRGDGVNRFTVLSKTIRTKKVNDSFFDSLIQQKRFQIRFQGPTRGPPRKLARPVVSYKDGETVGGNAPELGPENKGRALLEKMGWKKGTALGALDNKGILQPIAHTVKMTKAGLQ